MKITKYGHCCLLIEEKGVHILTDPGNYNSLPSPLPRIDAILLTHEHQDHVHIPHIQSVLDANKEAVIYTHNAVGVILEKEGIPFVLIADGEDMLIGDVRIQSFGTTHACIHHDLPIVQNTGFYIAEKLFYPGDSFHVPPATPEVLALPVAGPWMKLEECIEYAKKVSPKKVFPVHDGMLRQGIELGSTRRIPTAILQKVGIEYIDLREGGTIEV